MYICAYPGRWERSKCLFSASSNLLLCWSHHPYEPLSFPITKSFWYFCFTMFDIFKSLGLIQWSTSDRCFYYGLIWTHISYSYQWERGSNQMLRSAVSTYRVSKFISNCSSPFDQKATCSPALISGVNGKDIQCYKDGSAKTQTATEVSYKLNGLHVL